MVQRHCCLGQLRKVRAGVGMQQGHARGVLSRMARDFGPQRARRWGSECFCAWIPDPRSNLWIEASDRVSRTGWWPVAQAGSLCEAQRLPRSTAMCFRDGSQHTESCDMSCGHAPDMHAVRQAGRPRRFLHGPLRQPPRPAADCTHGELQGVGRLHLGGATSRVTRPWRDSARQRGSCRPKGLCELPSSPAARLTRPP